MKNTSNPILLLSKVVYVVGGIALSGIMLLTVADVVLRYLGMPITGSYEIVSFGAAIVVGFSLPMTSLMKGHVNVDFLLVGLRGWKKAAMLVATRVICMGLFCAIGVYLFKKALYMYSTGEVSLTLQMPFYPVAFGLGACCFMQCLVFAYEIRTILGGEYE